MKSNELKRESVEGKDPLSMLSLLPVSKSVPNKEKIIQAKEEENIYKNVTPPSQAARIQTPIAQSKYYEEEDRIEESKLSVDGEMQQFGEKKVPLGPSVSLEENKCREIRGLNKEQILEGESPVINNEASCEKSNVQLKGRIIMTNYKLVFVPEDKYDLVQMGFHPDYFEVALGCLSSIELIVDKKLFSSVCLHVLTKDGRKFRFIFPPSDQDNCGEKIYKAIKMFGFPSQDKYYNLSDTYSIAGWSIYNDLQEFRRMGANFESIDAPFRVCNKNNEWELSPTYPPRFLVPRSMTDKDVEECSKFRTKERLPALTYYYKYSGASIFRSSQPKEGIWGSSNRGDIKMMQSIIETLSSKMQDKHIFQEISRQNAKLHIYDARSKIAALGNKITGSGYENVDNYSMTCLVFCDIGNIHAVRESYLHLLELCNDIKAIVSVKWHLNLDKTEWFHHLAHILRSTNKIVESVRAGRAVLVHCSDGWDRTSQLAALAQIVLDGYYRTFVGFEVLIEKDFVSFGHMFKHRLGLGVQNALEEKEFCPVFIQFLDCVYQIMYQFPTLFEFNQNFLLKIAHHAFSLRFGTFLGNCEKDRVALKVRTDTTSLWTYLNNNIEEYRNPLYRPNGPFIEESCILPEPIVVKMKLWEELHMRWTLYSVKSSREGPHAFDSPLEQISFYINNLEMKKQYAERQYEKCKEELEKYQKLLTEHGIPIPSTDPENSSEISSQIF